MSSTPGFQGFATPRRRPTTPGRRDRALPTFNSPASAKIGRMLASAYANGSRSLDEETPDDLEDLSVVVASAAGAGAGIIAEEYDPPRIWFQRDEDKRLNADFVRRVDEMVQELKRLVRERNAEHAKCISDSSEKEIRINEEMSALEKENSAILSAFKTELNEEDSLSKTISGLKIKERQVKDTVTKLTSRRDKLRAELDLRKQRIAEKQAVLDNQNAKNSPELMFFHDILGISIVGGERRDLLAFVFTRISATDPDRPFTITVDLSQHEYKVAKCKPSIPELQTHVDLLNDSRDFFGFIRRVRHEFVEVYYNENV